MAISINYRFLIRIGGWVILSTAMLCVLLLQVLEQHAEIVPLWGQKSISTDLLTFSFAFGFVLNLIATKLTHKALLAKKVLPLHWHLKSQTLIDRLPRLLLQRAFMLGLAGTLMACLTLFLFRLVHVEQVPYQEYIVIFLLHAVSLAWAITVISVYRALGDYSMLRKARENKQSTSAS
ncbi:hypothetical protein [Pontibacter pamirensis]|uniref:hypothetical protein n=1 Tax=Pontibacter pamirensis TaxID=2562824 RepID=UPI001389CD89|nr:hypothetical protein [Pontibacter pamirensis]